MPKIELHKAPKGHGSRYPSPHDLPCRERTFVRLSDGAGLTQFGVNLLELAPGAWSSQRHWHSHEDEFVFVVKGEVTLVTDEGEVPLCAGESAGFRAGDRDGHTFQNRSKAPATLLVVGTRDDRDHGEYSDIDMKFEPGRYSRGPVFLHKDGTPYP